MPAVDESQEAEQPFTRADPTFHPSGATVEEGCSTVTTYDYAADFARLRRWFLLQSKKGFPTVMLINILTVRDW